MSHFIEISVDDEIVELELRPECIYFKCAKCGERVYGPWNLMHEYKSSEPQAFWCSECANAEVSVLDKS